jgi:hypothetical protein
MKLSDDDILELSTLCDAVVDETITEKQSSRLAHWLSTSPDAREFYVRTMGLSASLFDYAAEMQAGEPAAATVAATAAKVGRRSWWALGSLAVAASVVVILWLGRPKHNDPPPDGAIAKNVETAPGEGDDDDVFAARLTGSKETHWLDGAGPVALGDRLRKGQTVALERGFAEITFDSGAKVVLQGPASLAVDSAWGATFAHGTLKASVPPQAIGFQISTPTVKVVDLGTEFTMLADPGGAAAEVLVLKGEVEAAPRSAPDQQPILLREHESMRFAATGVTNVIDGVRKYEELTQLKLLEHLVAPTGYAHWSFDNPAGEPIIPALSGLSLGDTRGRMNIIPQDAVEAASSPGRLGNALRLSGNLYAKAAFPGMSANLPHTVAFWVKVPADANLSNAYAMIAWGANSEKFGSHPFHISWNRNPNEGVVGALRTDYGRGYALGNTSLRDGRWHHVAVVFMPTDDTTRRIEVKQYVDGRLEGEGRSSPPGSDIFMKTDNANATSGTIWLGCRLGTRGVRNERFQGELDELFIADRALQPQEIVRLITDNRL